METPNDKEYIQELGNKLMRIKTPDEETLRVLSLNKLEAIAKSKGYDAVYTKKASSFLIGKAFATELDDGGIFCYGLSEVSKKGVSIHANLVYPIKTSGGTVYVHKKKMVCYCWTAHFFDRYLQRSSVPKKQTRKNAIKDFLKEILKSGTLFNQNPTGGIRIFFKNGVCLGRHYAEKAENEMQVVICKTFVSTEMFNAEQKKIVEG